MQHTYELLVTIIRVSRAGVKVMTRCCWIVTREILQQQELMIVTKTIPLHFLHSLHHFDWYSMDTKDRLATLVVL